VWLANDYIVVYDRATSVHSGLFKRFNLGLVTNPVISGNTATETMADSQQLFIQTLLPTDASITAAETDTTLNPIAQGEPTKYTLTVLDPTNPTDTRFLHVLHGADPGSAIVAATRETSASGTAFDGTVFGSYAVYFPVSATASFTGTTLPAPSGVITMLVTGLTANASYTVSKWQWRGDDHAGVERWERGRHRGRPERELVRRGNGWRSPLCRLFTAHLAGSMKYNTSR
jgi:hypothetical protein